MALAKSFDDVRVAHAIAIIKARRCAPDTDRELHWKKKAKILKSELLALRQELHQVEEDATLDKLPSLAPCECLFLNTRLQETPRTTDGDVLLKKLSVQRFLKNVRILNRVKKNGRRRAGDLKANTHPTDLRGHLVTVVDFVVDLLGDPTPVLRCNSFGDRVRIVAVPRIESDNRRNNATDISDSKYFSTYMHQSVKFVEDALRHLLQEAETQELQVDTSVKKLTSVLSMNIMKFPSQKEIEVTENIDRRVWNQQIILELGSVPYIGQQFLLTVSKVIAEIAETFVSMDPFHEGVAQTYNNLFFLLQLFERLLSDHLCAWAKTSSFDEDNLQEAVRYHFQTVNLFQEFGNWSSLVTFYTDRITGEIITQLYKIVALNHKAEGSKHSALLKLVQSATSSILQS